MCSAKEIVQTSCMCLNEDCNLGVTESCSSESEEERNSKDFRDNLACGIVMLTLL